MSTYRRASHERVNVFRVEEGYLFKHYFEEQAVFDRLKRYYAPQAYRFEVPPDELRDVREFLAERGYGLVLVEAIAEFVVVVRKYTAHPENIFKESVAQRSVDDYNCFLMTDQRAVERATDSGARRLTETSLRNPF